MKLPNLVCIFLVTFVGNKQRCKAHESSVENVDSNVQIENEVTRSLRPWPNNRRSPVKYLCKQNTAALEVSLQRITVCISQPLKHQQTHISALYNRFKNFLETGCLAAIRLREVNSV